jgi:hypothetical protein
MYRKTVRQAVRPAVTAGAHMAPAIHQHARRNCTVAAMVCVAYHWYQGKVIRNYRHEMVA